MLEIGAIGCGRVVAVPHLRSEWSSGVVAISFGGERLALDFNKAQRTSGVAG
jgi:hypothetical protein